MRGSGTAGDYLEYLKAQQAEQAGVLKYTDIFRNLYTQSAKPISSAYSTQRSSLQQQAHRDVSQAYSNYLQNEMTMKHASNIASGNRDAYLDDVRFATDKSVTAISENLKNNLYQSKLNEANDLYTLSSDIAKQQEANEKELKNLALLQADYQKKINDYAFNKAYDADEGSIDATYLGLFDENTGTFTKDALELMYELDENNNQVLTQTGKDIYKWALYGFDDYAANNYSVSDYSKLLDEGIIYNMNEILTGDRINSYGDSPNAGIDATELIRSKNLKNKSFVDIGDFYDEYLGNYEADWVLTNQDSGLSSSNMYNLLENSPKNYDTSKYASYSTTPRDGYNTYSYSEEGNKLKEQLSAAMGKMKNNPNLKKGDVMKVGDVLIYYTGKNNFDFAWDTPEMREKIGIKK